VKRQVTKVNISKKAGKEARPEVRGRSFCADTDDGSKLHELLTPAEQVQLGQIATVLEYRAAGATIFSEGEDSHFRYAIDKGSIRLTRHLENGGRQILAFMWPGDLFGLAERGHYVNSAETLAPATIYRFPLQKLRSLLLREPQLQLHMLIKAAHDLRAAQRQIIVLGQQDTYRRLASFLLDLGQHVAFNDEAPGRLRLPMNRLDIADYLGTSTETVTRAFARLERDRLVSRLSPRSLRIDDLVGLTRLSQGRRLAS